MCWAQQVKVDSPQGERPKFYLRLDIHVGRCKFSKMSERGAASCGVNPKICGPQMHKLTTWEMQVDIGNRPMVLVYKKKAFVLKNVH